MTKKYFFDKLTCHYYLFDRLEFSHIQQYNIKQARETRTFIIIRVLLLLYYFSTIVFIMCVCNVLHTGLL